MGPPRTNSPAQPVNETGDFHRTGRSPTRNRCQHPDNGRLVIMLAGRVLSSTAHTLRLTLVIVVVAVALLLLLKAVPWSVFAQLIPGRS
jgi:hypothetical protein